MKCQECGKETSVLYPNNVGVYNVVCLDCHLSNNEAEAEPTALANSGLVEDFDEDEESELISHIHKELVELESQLTSQFENFNDKINSLQSECDALRLDRDKYKVEHFNRQGMAEGLIEANVELARCVKTMCKVLSVDDSEFDSYTKLRKHIETEFIEWMNPNMTMV